jgi:hypothetical protein
MMAISDASDEADAITGAHYLFAAAGDQHNLTLDHPRQTHVRCCASGAGSSIDQVECA